MARLEKNIQKKFQVKAPTIMLIFGATGDLAKNKLFPALFDLYDKGLLPDVFKVIGFAMDDLDDRSFRMWVEKTLTRRKSKEYTKKSINAFLKSVQFQKGLFEDTKAFQSLAERVIEVEEEFEVCANKVLYFAIPPRFYEDVLGNLAASGLTTMCSKDGTWSRVLVEKPFGKDLKSSRQLNKKLKMLFEEDQIYRIDHYLAKETVQNILSFRFSNRLFESIWDNENVDRIEIKLREKKGVAGRGSFYDQIGALRDVGQNHILQLLALIAMENPGQLEASAIQEKRAEVLSKLQRVTPSLMKKNVVRGQYEGFRKQKGVEDDSNTETFFSIWTEIDTKRWKSVPILLESGKELDETKTKITLYLKQANCLCPPGALHPHQNRIVFRIQPNEGISVVFWVKKTGFTTELEEKKLTFYYRDEDTIQFPDAYEKVLYDTLKGDQMLFASTKEVEAQWKFITPILEQFKNIPLEMYEKNTRGPENNNE